MKKIVLAINHKDTENFLMNELGSSFLDAGRPTYREAILPILKDKAVDILVLREELSGSTPFLKLIEDIRIESPMTRLVVITKERDKTDHFLSTLVSYGIYDIINKNKVPLDELLSHIRNPRSFRDVSMYFSRYNDYGKGISEKQVQSESTSTKGSGGLLGGLFGKPKTQPKKVPHSVSFQPLEGVTEATVDVEKLRWAIQEEERRKAQEGIDEIIASAVKKATEEGTKQIQQYQAEIAELRGDLLRKTNQADQARMDENQARVSLETTHKQLSILQDRIVKIKEEYASQFASLSKTEDPRWFQKQLTERDNQIHTLEQQISEKEQDLNSMRARVQDQEALLHQYYSENSTSMALKEDLAAAKAQISMLERQLRERPVVQSTGEQGDVTESHNLNIQYNEQFLEPQNGRTHTIVFLGAKHGVGNSTLALNTAVAIAKKGYKVLLMEFNGKFPMINHFFEFTNVTNGIDTACDGMKSNNTGAVDKAIIQPHRLKTQRRQLQRSYKKLPVGLHFMVYSNEYLTEGKKTVDLRAMKDIFYYLTMQLQYAYIIVDIQPDDEAADVFLKSGFLSDKLVLTTTQDTHSIVSAGYLVQKYAAGRSANLLKDATIILNRYQGGAAIKKADIQKWLSVSSKAMVCISDDPVVYFDSSSFGVPYACSKAKYVSEYGVILDALNI